MTKEDILCKFYEKKGEVTDAVVKERIDNICNLLKILPDDTNFDKEFPEIVTYLNGTSSRLSNDLDTTLDKLKECTSKMSLLAEGNAIQAMNQKTRFWLKVFMWIISLLAIFAVALTVLNLAYGEQFLNGWGDKLAGALGTLGFALGALGFVLERKDDMRKAELRFAAQVARETGDVDKLVNIVINNSNVASGAFSKVKDKSKVINNYGSRKDH